MAVKNVSMHLLVLSAFRLVIFFGTRAMIFCLNAPFGAQCFPTGATCTAQTRLTCLNAPFGAQCFPTGHQGPPSPTTYVSMHLLVLSAFRREGRAWRGRLAVSMHLLVLSAFRLMKALEEFGITPRLNAPFGAQCFPTSPLRWPSSTRLLVSMHLLVLSAFRRETVIHARGGISCLNAPFGAQCFPTPC